ncbi:het domain-containing protein [Seiridium cupressi]
MRLLNTHQLEMKEYTGSNVPPYAIVSHTWVEGLEISLQEFAALNELSKAKAGFSKIRGACKIAAQDGIDWIWIDTVCIDKASSAELTEAINSMYTWYKNSKICYAYLADVPDFDLKLRSRDSLEHFRTSLWFQRGWTLQELIAPRHMRFHSQSWTLIGNRAEPRLLEAISEVTGIEMELFTGDTDLHQVSIARKMSWVAIRTTTRIEDIAYCLLGLFEVNMPLLYGEGAKSFIRLQEEIIKTSNDHTIFCWARNDCVSPNWTGMLAPSPRAFAECGNYVTVNAWDNPMPYSMTNLGLSIHLPIIYTLTQFFVVLDAGLAQHAWDEATTGLRACIAIQRIKQRRTGSNIVDPCRSFSGPVILSTADMRDRYNLIIRSIHKTQAEDFYTPSLTTFRHGVMLFVDQSADKLLSQGRNENVPRGAVGYSILTHPHGIYDVCTATLRLPAFDGGSALLTSGLVEVRFTSPQDMNYWLFFAVMNSYDGTDIWYCSVHLENEFTLRPVLRGDHDDDDRGGGVNEKVHQCLREKAWLQNRLENRGQLSAWSDDHSIHVEIGGSVDCGLGGNVRAALISGEERRPHPVPLDGGGWNYLDDDDDDADYEFYSEDEDDEDDEMDEDSED